MSNHNDNEEINPFEKQLEEINEMQKNANIPGSSIGSGKVSLFYKNIFKSPIIMLIVGIIFAMPMILSLINNFSIESVFNNLMFIVISVVLIIGGIIRLIKRI